jgi:phage/plasmid primase-like uncharacterized protein
MTAREIVQALRGRWYGRYGLCFCPAHDDGKEPGLKVWEGDDGPLVNCFGGCDFRDVRGILRQRGLLPEHENEGRPPNPALEEKRRLARQKREREEAEDARRRAEKALAIWRECQPAEGTAAEVYLRSRAITIPPPCSIRYHASLPHGPTALRFETMVCGIQAPDGKVHGIHRTYLLPGGRGKARIQKPKMMLGSCSGGAVRLALAGSELVLTEGIETGLSVLQATGKPTWATLSTSGLKAVVLPPKVAAVIIAADGDEPGAKAAEEVAKRFLAEERTVKIAAAPPGRDWNDVLMLPSNVTALNPRETVCG